MRKDLICKIADGEGCLRSSDMTAEEKETLFAAFGENGMKRMTAYNRFFRDGFRPWELEGLEACVAQYCAATNIPAPEDMARFWSDLSPKEPFKVFMEGRGLSRAVLLKYITIGSLPRWKLKGVRRILEEMAEKEVHHAEEDKGASA